ncbi:RimJ/RimL family protein N-acetyltransferase [Paenibacillus endophyticus]|uniref:RimJ/RimL family protein N-acetyltransferase n=1 Tax=Paenibacillus endophyticus TaxID=1294268 RepID=A0A7W5GC67_9BACL|nr:GNAT family N-acetyltransferase [Paenibacillus endophyticus]MBB3154163.1 RimJ/RimL family protein N-acetyltransferase [Paenibacillus endophyticus]
MSGINMNPLLLPVPESFESSRLLIRAPLWGDGAPLNNAVIESRTALLPWMPWAEHIPTMEDSELVIRKARLRYLERTDLMLLLFLKDTGELVGSSGLHRIDWEARKFEIGYWVRTSCSGMGYISEAVEAITGFAIQELAANRIEIRCDARNIRSAKVAERSGYTREGILRKEKAAVDGSLRDTMVFAKVRGFEF